MAIGASAIYAYPGCRYPGLTARGPEVDRVVGLELGADDYIVTPNRPSLARVRVLYGRRCTAIAAARRHIVGSPTSLAV